MKISKILQDSISIKEVIDNLGLNLDLKERGPKLVGNCIKGHSSNSATCFHVFESGYFCHNCGCKGNIFELLKEAKGYEFKESLSYLIDNFKPELRKKGNRETSYTYTKEQRQTYLKATLYEEVFKLGKELLYTNRGAEDIVYLLNDRKYTEENLRRSEWFYLPPEKEVREHLLKTFKDANQKTKEFITGRWVLDKEEGKNVFEGLSLRGFYGDNFRLAFPYRDRGGAITGFIKRASAPDGVTIKKKDKVFDNVRYDSSFGLSKNDLFNLCKYKNIEEVLLVEGYPDSLYFHTLGINTVAIGQGAFSETHIEGLKSKGIKRVTISLDNDGKEKGEKNTKNAIELLLKNGITPFIVPPKSLGEVKDLDEYLRLKGERDLKNLISTETVPHYLYLFENILDSYLEKENSKGQLSAIDLDQFKEEVVSLGSTLQPIDKDLFTAQFLKRVGEALGITKESLEATIEQLRFKTERNNKKKLLENLLKDSEKKVKEGKLEEAQKLIEEKVKAVKVEQGKELLEPYSYLDFIRDIKDTPEALKTGFEQLDKIIRIPVGVLSLIAGKPSHGKTTLMYNMMLKMAELYPEKKFYFFSYEEPREFILVKLLHALINTNLGELNLYPELSTSLSILKAYLRDNRFDVEKIEDAKIKLEQLLNSGRINVIDKKLVVEQLSSLIHYLGEAEEVGAVFVDYAQKVTVEAKGLDMRLRIAHVSNTLLIAANNTKIPVLLGSQFNREGAKKDKPQLHDLKEASNLEEDASLVLRVYNATKDDEEDTRVIVPLEITALKQRDGIVNISSELTFNMLTSNISDSKNFEF